MRMDKFTNLFQTALADAQSMALGHDNQVIEPEHLLLALLAQEGGSISAILEQAGANISVLENELQTAISRFAKVEGAPGQVHLSNSLSQLLNRCDQLAQKNKDQFISSELFLTALMEVGATATTQLQAILKKSGVKEKSLTEAITKMRGNEKVNDANAEGSRNALD